MKYIRILFLFLAVSFAGCADYLDIVPDEILTMDQIFANRNKSEQFLFTCYSYTPKLGVWNSPVILGEDEYWQNIETSSFLTRAPLRLAMGYQNADNPLLNYWNGEQFRYDSDQKSLFQGIRDCNIFLENIHTPLDMEEKERVQWIAEAKFLKAFYHLFLMQMYGPIPITKENISVSASPEEVRVFREPVSEVVEYIAQLVDEAMPDLPASTNETMLRDAGRATKPMAAALKARARVWEASPLFNDNNPQYANFVDSRGKQLIPTTYDPDKWVKARDAIKEAIDICDQCGHSLAGSIDPDAAKADIPILKYFLRAVVTSPYNQELIWPISTNTNEMQSYMIPYLSDDPKTNAQGTCEIHPTLKIAEQYYSHNGIPIEEDKEWINFMGGGFGNRYDVMKVSDAPGINGGSSIIEDHLYYLKANDTTAKLHFYREPRFYASIGFDRAIWEGNGHSMTETNFHLKARRLELQGRTSTDQHSATGYFAKKMIHFNSLRYQGVASCEFYPFPYMRLSDLYLLYAEALNETGDRNGAKVWLNKVRARAGLYGVDESWQKSTMPGKPNSLEGLREIIRHERLIELAMEGQRFWDLRRWKEAMKEMNQAVLAWNFMGATVSDYYQLITLQSATKRAFKSRDYLWPIKVKDLQINANLVQNPGWPSGLQHNEQYY
jgi:hypothetical protein